MRLVAPHQVRNDNPLGLAQQHNAQLPLVLRTGGGSGSMAGRLADVAGVLLHPLHQARLTFAGGQQEQLVALPAHATTRKGDEKN